MTEGKRLTRLSRRAVLGGLAAGAGSGFAGRWGWAAEDDGPNEALSSSVPIEIAARPILHFQPGQPHARRFGDVEFRGGLALASTSRHFGGWSGLVLASDGNSLLGISDVGSWLSADLAYESGRPSGLTRARLGPLRDTQGRPLQNKWEQDAESLTLLEGTLAHGTLLIGFERHHRIGRFPIRDREVQAPAGYLKMPSDSKRMKANQGIEALAVLKAGPHKGAVVAFAERLTGGSGYHMGWIWKDGEPHRFHLRDIDGFNITDAAGLPDGGLLVLERYFRWTAGIKMRIRRLSVDEIAPGARLVGRTVLEADSSYEIDNMEGIAVHRGSRGETVVSLISDDNFNQLMQRTLFLQFTLVGSGAKSATNP
jgi:hypothetical protein